MATRTIGTELKLTGEKEFNQQMKAVNAGLKTTRSDMAALTSSFGDNANSMGNLMKKQKLLQSSVDQHKAKVDALEKQYKAAAKQYGENSAMAQKYKQDLNSATVALNKETAALEKNADAMKGKYLAALKGVGSGAKKALSGVGTVASGMGKMVGSASAAAAAGVVAIGVAAGAALLGMANMAKESAEAAKAAHEAGEELSDSQKQWLEYSNQLDSFDSSVADAKSAIAGILLPALSSLATEGTAFLNAFSNDMAAAAGDTGKQGEIMGKYIADGIRLIMEKLPEYVSMGKDLLGGVIDGFKEAGPDLLDMGLDLIMDLLEFIMDQAPALADAGLELIMQLIEGLDGENFAGSASQMISKLVNSLAAAAPKLIPAAFKLIGELILGLVQNADELLKAGGNLIVGIVEGIVAGLGAIFEMGPEILEELKRGIAEAWNSLVSWFNNLWDSLFGGREVYVDVNAAGANGVDGSHANGLRYVPFDGYVAQLHRGEAVLTANEAAAYRSGQGSGKVFNMTINTTSVSKEDMDMLVDYMNGKLGEELP